MRRLFYFAGKGFRSVRDSPGISLLTAGTVGATLFVAGLYVMALQNLEGLALIWGRTATLTAYIDDAVPPEGREPLRARLEAFEQVEHAVLVSPIEALERFKARGASAAALVEGVSEEILPASIELQLEGGFADLTAVEKLALQTRELPGVTDVDYGQQELERLQTLLDLLRMGGLIAGILIAIATAFIVSNTIRLTVYARRDEIIILRLVGATNGFIRTPYLFEGLIWGLAGGGASALMMWLADVSLAPQISIAVANVVGGLNIHLFNLEVAGILVVAGVFLGVFGSGLAVGRFIDQETS